MKEIKKRLSELEQQSALDAIETMSDTELDAFLDEDPIVRGVMENLPSDELELLATGDKRANRLLEKQVSAARRQL